MGKKKSGGGVTGFILLVLLVAVAAIPVKVWIGIFITVVVVVVLVKIFQPTKKQVQYVEPPPLRRPSPSAPSLEVRIDPPQQTAAGALPSAPVTVATNPSQQSFRIPPPTKRGSRQGRWIPAGEEISVGKLRYAGGMVYFGESLPAPGGENDPALIDPSKGIANSGDFRERQTQYWPSYSTITPGARRSYVNWLIDGRRNPEADIGFVFLFFYGLERRAIVDVAADLSVRAEWPAIADELRQLLAIYGKNSSFRSYAGGLLEWVTLDEKASQPIGALDQSLEKGFEIPLWLKYALGKTALDETPVPAQLALAWARLHPEIQLRTAATRCPSEFNSLFAEKYAFQFGRGIQLPKNRTKLKLVYRPASAGFRGYKDITRSFGGCPDVSVLTAPVKKLQELAHAVCKDLDPYSRYVGKNPNAKSSLEALLQLPLTLWPDKTKQALKSYLARVGDGILVLQFRELLEAVEAQSAPTKERIFGLAKALESLDIAVEPDILAGAKTPKADAKIVLFHLPSTEVVDRSSVSYKSAQLTLQLSSAVASADGDFSASEMNFLRAQIDAWAHLTSAQRHRLRAHLRLLISAPVTLTSLKKRVEPLSKDAREALGSFMAGLVQADGKVSAEELKLLEKTYKALGLDPKRVYADVHASGDTVSSPTPVPVEASDTPASTEFKLDPARIAALQRDTEKVSNLLANIFTEEEEGASAVPAPEAEEESVPGLMGLDPQHSSFARTLISRPQWTRDELLDIAGDMDLMLDGALEKVNEASYDAHGIPFTEGDDPIEVNQEILEKVAA